MRLSKKLDVTKTKEPDLGEIFVIYSKADIKTGDAAYFIDEEGGIDTGVGIRVSRKTALKLVQGLTKLLGKKNVRL